MLDVARILAKYIYDSWTETDPAKADLQYTHHLHGFDAPLDPNKCYPQIVILNQPARITYLTDSVDKVVHNVIIRIFLRPVKYTSTVIEAHRTTFRNMKSHIKKILRDGRYAVECILRIDSTNWRDETKEDAEPIVFQASMIVKCLYYNPTIECDCLCRFATTQAECEALDGCSWNPCTKECTCA